MKRFTAISFAALMVLAVFVMPASAAMDTVEVRGPVYSGADLDTIIGALDTDFIEMNALNFAGFYYDIDDGISTEGLKIYGGNYVDGRTIEKDGIVYTTTIQQVDYDSSNLLGQYNIIGLFAEEFVPLKNNTPDKLAKLLLDNDDKYTMRTGTSIDLAGGYSLTAKQIDVEGDKVWMELTKDGEFLEDEVIDVSTNPDGYTWTYDRDDVADEDDVVVFKANISDVFQGQADSLAVIEGMWLIDFEDVLEIESDDEFGELDVDVGDTSLIFTNEDATITLSKDSDQDIAEGLSFRVANNDDSDVRFYLMKEYTEPGTYEIRGTVYEDVVGYWDESSFAGFFYDIDDDIATETLEILALNGRVIEKDDLVYTTTIQQVDYDSSNLLGQFNIIGLFAEEYVPLKNNTPDKLAKLLLDNDDKYTMRTGTSIDLAGGYSLTAKQIDVEGDKVWMELTKDGEFLEDEVIDVSTNPDGYTWTYDRDDVADEDDVIVFKANISDVFQGQADSLAVIEGMWLIDFEDVLEIESDDEFGELDVDVGDTSLIFTNQDATITLTRDSEQDIAENMKFKVADSDTLRYYLYVEKTIDGAVTPKPTVVETEEVEETEVVEETEEAEGTEVVEETEVAEETEEVEETEEAEETEEVEEEPGFEAIFAIAGLLAVAYLVRRD